LKHQNHAQIHGDRRTFTNSDADTGRQARGSAVIASAWSRRNVRQLWDLDCLFEKGAEIPKSLCSL
jgi:hypothetical protein